VTSRFEYADSFTLERYLATGGYSGLRKALGRPAGEVHDEVKNPTILGRGGAGFPAGTKWGLTPQNKWPRYLVVNGDESEPGTYKDRLLMERDPHQLIEGRKRGGLKNPPRARLGYARATGERADAAGVSVPCEARAPTGMSHQFLWTVSQPVQSCD